MDTAMVRLKVDILDRFTGEMIFQDKEIETWADIYNNEVDCFDEDVLKSVMDRNYRQWKSCINAVENKYNNNKEYLYTLILKEFYSDDEVEDYTVPNRVTQSFSDYVLLVKEENINWLTFEKDYEANEPGWDLIRKEQELFV